MAKRKKIEKPIDIVVLSGPLRAVERSTGHILNFIAAGKETKTVDDSYEAEYLAELAAERRRIKEINKYVDGRTLTEMRLRGGPMATLLNRHKIGGEEFRAIMDIELAFQAVSGGLMFKAVSLELKSPGMKPEWSSKTSDAVQRFQPYANFWTQRRVFGDPTWEIVVASVIEGRAFRVIEEDVGLRHGMASKIAVRGLRDYAARARWVEPAVGRKWQDDALTTHRGNDPLALAMSRHAAARFEEAEAGA